MQIKKSLCSAQAAQGFLRDAKVGCHHAQRYAVVDVVVNLQKVVVLFLCRCKPHRGNALHQVPEDRTHGKAGVALHFRELIEQRYKVVDIQAIGFGVFDGIDVIDVGAARHQAFRRIAPLLLCRKIFRDLFVIFQEIGAEHARKDKIAVGAGFGRIQHQLPFFEMYGL